jgi:uncharacterized protein (UPF0332 family)
MTLHDDEREAMSRLYMDKAYEALLEARDTQEQHPNVAVTRAYYSMFYAAQSALVAEGVAGLRRHEGVNSNFGKLFVKTGKFPKEVARTMGEAENDRYKADYSPGIKFTSLDAEKHIENAEKFMNSVKEMMAIERGKDPVRESQTRAAEEEFKNNGIIPQIGQRVTFQPYVGKSKLTGNVIAADECTVTLRCGKMEIPTIREKGLFFEAPPLMPEETKEYAQNLARKHVGENGQVFFARKEGVYKGVVVELTSLYVIQKVNEETAVLHRLKDLENEKVEERALINEGESISIVKYGMNVTITPWNREHENDREKNRGSQGRMG